MPKFPPPPRIAQKRSECLLSLAVTMEPSARTTSTSRIVDGEAILSGEIPVPTTQRQSSDAGAADDTSWHVKAKGMRCVIDVALGVAWAAEESQKMIVFRK